MQDARLKRLKEWRIKKAAELGMDPGILVNNSLLDGLAEAAPLNAVNPSEITGLKDWQIRAFGQELLRVLKG
jgi:ribonuclease D